MTVRINRKRAARPRVSRTAIIAPSGRPKYSVGKSAEATDESASGPPLQRCSATALMETNADINTTSRGIASEPPKTTPANAAHVNAAAIQDAANGTETPLARA